jgi:hypothetical protein
MTHDNDADLNKGAVEQDRPSQESNTSLHGQLPHREENPTIKAQDTDYPEPGESPEHSGEPQGSSLLNRDAGCGTAVDSPEGETQDQEPGQRQKRNQGEKKDDPLAA